MQRSRHVNEYAALSLFAALTGLLGQTLIPWLSGQLNSRYLEFRFVVSNIDAYPFAVVALITFKNAEPKKALFRILAFFSGLCPGYYGYTAALAACSALGSGNAGYLANVLSDAQDAFEYMVIALCVGAWGFAMQKVARRRFMYRAMLAPFILITAWSIYSNLACNPPQILMFALDVLCMAGIFMCSSRKGSTSG